VKKSAIAAAAVIALVGAAAAAVPVVERLAAAQVKSGIESDGVTKIGSVEIGLFDRRITLHDLKSAGPSDVSVGRWQASGLTWPLGELLRGRTPIVGFQWGDPLRAERVELQDLRLVDRAAGSRWSMDWLGIDGLDLARFDVAYFSIFRCNRQRIADFPNLSRYLRELYRVPGVAATVKPRYYVIGYWSVKKVNPSGIIPKGAPAPYLEEDRRRAL